MVKEATYNSQLGILLGGQVCNMIRFADDKAVLSSTHKGFMDDLNIVTQDYGMKINTKKTKVMYIYIG